MSEESQPELADLDLQEAEMGVNSGLVNVIQRVISYCIQKLPTLIINDKGEVVWTEAFDSLQQKVAQRTRQPANEVEEDAMLQIEIADTVESLINGISISKVDDSIKKLPFYLRFAIGAGTATAKTLLSMDPSKKEELSEKGQDLILKMMQSSKDMNTIKAYELLRTRPNTLDYITRYLFWKLSIPLKPQPPVYDLDDEENAQPESA